MESMAQLSAWPGAWRTAASMMRRTSRCSSGAMRMAVRRSLLPINYGRFADNPLGTPEPVVDAPLLPHSKPERAYYGYSEPNENVAQKIVYSSFNRPGAVGSTRDSVDAGGAHRAKTTKHRRTGRALAEGRQSVIQGSEPQRRARPLRGLAIAGRHACGGPAL